RRLDATEESGEHVEGERQGLEPDEDDQQVEAPRHQGNAEVPPQKESVELALLLARALQGGFGDQDRQGRATSQEQADEKRQRRGLQPPPERRPERRTRQKKERSGDSEESHRREPPPQLRRERFEQQDDAAGDGKGRLRGDRRHVRAGELHERLSHGLADPFSATASRLVETVSWSDSTEVLILSRTSLGRAATQSHSR